MHPLPKGDMAKPHHPRVIPVLVKTKANFGTLRLQVPFLIMGLSIPIACFLARPLAHAVLIHDSLANRLDIFRLPVLDLAVLLLR